MDHLTSPKLTPGVHCLNLRHKGMFVTSGPDPDEFTFYDKYDSTAYWWQPVKRLRLRCSWLARSTIVSSDDRGSRNPPEPMRMCA